VRRTGEGRRGVRRSEEGERRDTLNKK